MGAEVNSFPALLVSLGMCFPAAGTMEMCGHGALSPADVQDVHRTGQLGAWPARQTWELLTVAGMEMPARRLSFSHGWQGTGHQTTGRLWELPMDRIGMIKKHNLAGKA